MDLIDLVKLVLQVFGTLKLLKRTKEHIPK